MLLSEVKLAPPEENPFEALPSALQALSDLVKALQSQSRSAGDVRRADNFQKTCGFLQRLSEAIGARAEDVGLLSAVLRDARDWGLRSKGLWGEQVHQIIMSMVEWLSSLYRQFRRSC